MKDTRFFARNSFPSLAGLCLFTLLAALVPAGCNLSGHTSDPHLKQIDQMIDSQLPTGTTKARVVFYLNSQGFQIESTTDPRAIVATVHHVDTETLQPASALVTFHFDAAGNLKSYELVAAPGSGSQP
jgi:hypothetical protein